MATSLLTKSSRLLSVSVMESSDELGAAFEVRALIITSSYLAYTVYSDVPSFSIKS